MDEAQLIGYLVLGVITLGSFFTVVRNFTRPMSDLKEEFTKSIHELTLVMQDLKSCIEALKANNNLVNKRLERHGEEIDELMKRVQNLETKMEMYHH